MSELLPRNIDRNNADAVKPTAKERNVKPPSVDAYKYCGCLFVDLRNGLLHMAAFSGSSREFVGAVVEVAASSR